MENKYLEKIAHWAGYLVKGEKKFVNNLVKADGVVHHAQSQMSRYAKQHISGAASTKGYRAKRNVAESHMVKGLDAKKKIVKDYQKAEDIKGTAKDVGIGAAKAGVIAGGAGASVVAAKKLTSNKDKKS